jgi:hypothetical protein
MCVWGEGGEEGIKTQNQNEGKVCARSCSSWLCVLVFPTERRRGTDSGVMTWCVWGSKEEAVNSEVTGHQNPPLLLRMMGGGGSWN